MNTSAKGWFPHIVALVAIFVLNSIYFAPQWQGKVVQQGDIISHRGMSKEMKDFKEETGEKALWTNAMFGGMPTYQIDSGQPSNMLSYVVKATQLFMGRPIGYFISLMIGFYVLLVLLGVSPWLSLIGAIGFGLSTNNLILYSAGHLTKILAISFFALITAGMILTLVRKQYLLGGLVFTLGVGAGIYVNHVQMIYYFFLTLLVFGIIQLIQSAKADELPHFFKASAILIFGLFLGVTANTSKLWTTYEYSKDTMRGDPILESSSATPASSSETSGLEWEYAMNWSNGFLDLFASFIPGAAGGSSGELIGPTSETAKILKRKGVRVGPEGINVPVYWGSLPGTSGPAYFGAIFCFLFILGLILVKGPVKWWLGIAVFFTMLLSMGKHFSILNELFFNYFPLFNKFRTPNSILAITAFLLPLLGIIAMGNILTGKYAKDEVMKALKITLGITGGIALFFGLIGPSFFDFVYNVDPSHSDKFYGERYGLDIPALRADRQSLMRMDGLRTFALVLATAALIWAFIQNKIKQNILLGVLAVLVIFDMWTVGQRYLNSDSFVKESQYKNNFKPRPVDERILAQEKSRGNYRVLDLAVNTFNSASTSYFHNTVGGYHPAKLQRYQDIIDRHISNNNQEVLNMLNTKYIISREGQLQNNPAALGNAWFVERIKTVNTPNEEIDALGGEFDPVVEAVVHKEYSDYIAGFTPQKSGQIRLKEYSPIQLTYETNAPSDQFAVFSEVWYGPDKGWNAYIDGSPVEHIRADYLLRALKIPAGQHSIEFKFEPRAYFLGETITLIFSSLILLGFLGFVGFKGYEFYQNPPEPIEQKKEPSTVVKKTVSKTKKRKKKD